MTVTDKPDKGKPDAPDDAAGDVASRQAAVSGSGARDAGTLRRAWPYALELVALTAFVVARPVLASFGRSPETFIARGADWTDVLTFVLVLVLGPPLAVIAIELLVGLVAGERARRLAHLAAVAALVTLAVWQLIESLLGWDNQVAAPVAAVVGVVAAAAWARWRTPATFVRYAAVGAVVFALQFLVMSPTSSIVLGGRHATGAAAGVEVDAAAPPVVMVIFDGLPTGMLLDGTGHIDAELYPNFAELADDATWYRNHTSVAQVTLASVPAILSGQQPSPDQPPPVASNYPDNIFTLLDESHEVHGAEAITGLCPVRACPEQPGSPLGGLLHDAGYIWRSQMSDRAVDPELVPHVFQGRYERADDWIAAQDFEQTGRPNLHVLHLLVPHPAWEYLPDGSEYQGATVSPQGLFLGTWSEWAVDVARQRHVLQIQAADRQLGELMDRLRADGAYDDAVVAVTADHGYAFTDDAPWRAIDPANFDEVMWTPLIVKSPGQRAPVIDNSNVNSLDIVPTIAAEVGVDELPWDADGQPVGTVERDPDDKWIVDWPYSDWHPEGDGDLLQVDGTEGFERVLAADPVEGTGPRAVWERTEHGALVGRDVDDLEVGDPHPEALAVTNLDQWDDVDTDLPPLELVGRGAVPSDAPVAITVDGVVAAVVPSTPTSYGVAIVHALLWPDAVGAGRNEIGAYVVDGEPGDPLLHEIEVEASVDP